MVWGQGHMQKAKAGMTQQQRRAGIIYRKNKGGNHRQCERKEGYEAKIYRHINEGGIRKKGPSDSHVG